MITMHLTRLCPRVRVTDKANQTKAWDASICSQRLAFKAESNSKAVPTTTVPTKGQREQSERERTVKKRKATVSRKPGPFRVRND
jgi:hypothetical protein